MDFLASQEELHQSLKEGALATRALKENSDQLKSLNASLEREIAERRRVEEELKGSEERFRSFMETASDLMHMADKDGNFTYVNEATARTLGYSKEEMMGMHITQIFNRETFEPRLQELITNGEIIIDPTWLTKDGVEILGEAKVVAVYDGEGRFAGSRCIFRDITERKRAEEALRLKDAYLEMLFESAPPTLSPLT